MTKEENDEHVIANLFGTAPTSNVVRGHSVTWLLILVGACSIGLVVFARQDTKLVSTAQDVSTKLQHWQHSSDTYADVCLIVENASSLQASTRQLLRRAQTAKEQAVQKLKVQYGEEYYNKLFLTDKGESIGRTAIVSPDFDPNEPEKTNVSRTRFVRKLMLKILNVLLQYESCHCGSGLKQSTRQRLQDSAFPSRFVWVTGGHSAAAGHGNFYEESFTAVMERSAKAMFASVGINLEGRNYAMGGMASTPELALCTEAVYGLDADVITWHFGMTDGRAWWRKGFYGNRVGTHRNRPALVELGITASPRTSGGRLAQLTALQNMGLTGLYLQCGFWENLDPMNKLPDMQNKTQEEMDALPEFVRHFKCGEGIESGDPTCGANKFTQTTCRMSGRDKWHPGWKGHALQGNFIAIFMMDALLEALETLVDTFENDKTITVQAIFDTLQQRENDDYELFFNTSVAQVDPGFIPQDAVRELNTSILFRDRALCHTALLPSETRYLGVLTDTRDGSSFEHFETGSDYRQNTTNNKMWRLVCDQNEHNKNKDCPKLEHIDYKDWFYVQTENGETTVAIPNKAEQEVYLEKHKLNGYVVMCLVTCPWGKCPKGTITWEDVNDGSATLWVNGETVTEVTKIDVCVLLKGKEGYSWKADANGRYKVTAKINRPDSFLKVSSVILL